MTPLPASRKPAAAHCFLAVESEFHRFESGDRLPTTSDRYFRAMRDLIEKDAQLTLRFERFDFTREITVLRNLCISQGRHSELAKNPETKYRIRDPFAPAAFAQGDTMRLALRFPKKA
jgi:hypothetical protein